MEIDVLTSSFLGLRDKLHHIALNYLESDEDAKDALQDTWLKLRNGSKVETTSEAKNKLVTVLRHVCIDHLRKAKSIPIDTVSAYETKGYNMDVEDLKHLETLLQKGLTPQQREIFDLVTHEGMEYEQIAEKLSMTVEAVRMNMSRIRKKMRETYNKLNR
jgi:RNA polymerase sigma-70 factor (ECF subfamily)